VDNPLSDNPYIFGDAATDRYRLETQTRLFSKYILSNVHRLVGNKVSSILDLGCGEGQLGFALREIYPNARLVGIDRNEQAIAGARLKAKEAGLENCEFVVGDIQQGLAAGPFDLIYASVVMIHTQQPAAVLKLAYEALGSGGTIWIKDLHLDIIKAFDNPDYLQLATMFFDTLAKIGVHPYIATEIPALLTAAGFSGLHSEIEHYPFGGSSKDGQVMLAITLGAFYNARTMVSKMNGVPVSELEQMYVGILNEAMQREQPIGNSPFINVIARKPAQLEEGKVPEPVNNPYIFSDDETDRYRLETQTRLFSEYIRSNAQHFVGDNVRSILDLGCGEGQLGFALREVYPEARLVGIDRDPKAIGKAQAKAAERKLDNCQFIVGDVEQQLAGGPYDLVYASLILLHTRQPEKVVGNVFAALNPGGYFWAKEGSTQAIELTDEPNLKELYQLMGKAMTTIGVRPNIGGELPGLLAAAGYEQVRQETEVYALGGQSQAGQVMFAVTVGAMYNARGMINKVLGVEEIEVERLYVGLVNSVLMRQEEVGQQQFANVIARKPPGA